MQLNQGKSRPVNKNMLRVLFFAFQLFIFGVLQNSYAQDTLNWRADYKLTWDDFQGEVEKNGIGDANTMSGISYSFVLTDTLLKFKVNAFFDKKKSWRKAKIDSEMLAHEQGHFDITEYYARKLLVKLKKIKYNTINIKDLVRKIFEQIINEKECEQNLYDLETDFGRDQNKQTEWLKRILVMLNK